MSVTEDCIECGARLVLEPGIPTACWNCGCQVVSDLASGDVEEAKDNLLGVAVGVGLGLIAVGILAALFGGERR